MEFGRLVDDVNRRGDLSAVVEKARNLELVPIAFGHREAFERTDLAALTASASSIVSIGTRSQWPLVYGDLSSIAALMRLMKDSKSSSRRLISSRFVSAIAACEASDSARCRSASENAPTAPVAGPWR